MLCSWRINTGGAAEVEMGRNGGVQGAQDEFVSLRKFRPVVQSYHITQHMTSMGPTPQPSPFVTCILGQDILQL